MGLQDDIEESLSRLAFNNSDAMPGNESVSYYIGGAQDQKVVVTVNVFRQAPASDGNGMFVLKTKIFLARGAGVDTVLVNRDSVSIAKVRGGTPELHRVASIESDDAGGWMLVLN